MSGELGEFLLARIADDEQDAGAIQRDIDRWHRERAAGGADGSQGSITLTGILGTAADPARVLAQCEAHRRIVGLHPEMLGWCQGCGHESHPCRTLVALAAIYADHPDYREEWRP